MTTELIEAINKKQKPYMQTLRYTDNVNIQEYCRHYKNHVRIKPQKSNIMQTWEKIVIIILKLCGKQ